MPSFLLVLNHGGASFDIVLFIVEWFKHWNQLSASLRTKTIYHRFIATGTDDWCIVTLLGCRQ